MWFDHRPGGAHVAALLLILLLAGAAPLSDARDTLNGFDLSDLRVERDLVRSGGPPRDGIPSIDQPVFQGPQGADRWLEDDDRVLGIVVDGEARAYPVRILNWHEIVNDRIGDTPLLVTWCPLCGSGVAYDPRIEGHDGPLEFGVSGLLYNSDVLFYDRATESLWSQLEHRAVSGPLAGARLETVFLRHTSWGDWRERHPQTRVLARPRFADGRLRAEYDRNPYEGYVLDRRLMFPVGARDRRFHPKEEVFGLELDGIAVAWPYSALQRAETPLRARVGDRTVIVHYDARARSAWATDADGTPLIGQQAFWFAWYAFHPETEVRLAR
jgi:hypothetical protein